MKDSLPLILASASPRRAQILRGLQVRFEVVVPRAEEVHWDDDPVGTVLENARRKCFWCHDRYPNRRIVAADTVVALDGRPIAKPRDMEEASAFLRRFSGRGQHVYTGVAFISPPSPVLLSVAESVVEFRELTEELIAEYFRRVDPLDKAGGYNIDQHGDLIVAQVDGSWTNVMGLPAEVIEPWLGLDR